VFSLRSTGVAGYRLLGTVGSVLVASAGWAAGVPLLSSPALLIAFCGVTLLVAAWWWAGRETLETSSLSATLACWAAPLALAPPMFSRDVYSYLVQGAMVSRHIDVYAHGAAYLGGPLTAQIPAVWLDTPAPYGPVFLELTNWVSSATDGDLIGGLVGMRLLAVAGVAVFAAILPHLAKALGADPGRALWLGALNPLVPLHLIAGTHNEAVMLALLSGGLLLAMKHRFTLAAVFVTLAALVKAPAALALPAVAILWARGTAFWRAATLTALTAGITVLTVSSATGLGLGWIPALKTPAASHSWSISSAVGRTAAALVIAEGGRTADAVAARQFWVSLGVAAAIVLIGLVWVRREPIFAAGLALAAVAFLGPATRPWYALWALIPLAVAVPRTTVHKLAAATAAVLAFTVMPSGYGPDPEQAVIAAAGIATAILVLVGFGLVKPGRRTEVAIA
jgi:hypothetical protein